MKLQQINDGIIIKVKVIPKASSTAIVGWEGDELKIRLKAVPEKGEANNELIRFLATFFQQPKSRIKLIQGASSRHKKIMMTGVEIQKIESLINLFLIKE